MTHCGHKWRLCTVLSIVGLEASQIKSARIVNETGSGQCRRDASVKSTHLWLHFLSLGCRFPYRQAHEVNARNGGLTVTKWPRPLNSSSGLMYTPQKAFVWATSDGDLECAVKTWLKCQDKIEDWYSSSATNPIFNEMWCCRFYFKQFRVHHISCTKVLLKKKSKSGHNEL